MTGNDYIFECQTLLGESLSTSAQQQSQLYPRHVMRAANTVAERTYCLYRSAVCDLVSGQAEYESPYRPYKETSVCVKDTMGNIYPLASIEVETANARYPLWQNNPVGSVQNYTGQPMFYIPEGLKAFRLFPIPNYNAHDGLIVSGYFGVDEWWDMTQESPLPKGTAWDQAVVTCTARYRCEEMIRQDPTYKDVYVIHKANMKEQLNHLYGVAMQANKSRTEMVPMRASTYPVYAGWGFWGS